MSKQFATTITIVTACFTYGCATTRTDGIVPIGPDLYMVGEWGRSNYRWGSDLKAKLFQDASKYCADKGRTMLPVDSTDQDASTYSFASAEIQFRCILPTDATTNTIVPACLTYGCATTRADGIVPIGPDLYMVGEWGKSNYRWGSDLKAKLFQDASKYCADKGRTMLPVNSTDQDASTYSFASAEIQFRCILPTAPRVTK